MRHNIVVNAAHGTPRGRHVPYGILAHKGWDDGYSLWLYGRRRPCPGSSTVPCVIFNLPGRSCSLRTNMTTGPSAGAWHHVVGTYDGATMTLYQDGAVVTPLAKTGNIAPSGAEADVYIGQGDLPRERQNWSGEYEGDIDEVRISNVTPLRQLDPERVPQPVGPRVFLRRRGRDGRGHGAARPTP